MMSEEDNSEVKSVAIILAAGSSSRMGQSKQLLKIGNESLLRQTVQTVTNSGVEETVIILGSGQQAHQEEIIDLPVKVIYNPDWQKGIGSSLKCGVRFIEERFPACETILVTVCDQPLLSSKHLRILHDSYQSEKNSIVSSYYSDSPGVPVLFNRSMFKKLLEVDDQHGAKMIIKENIELALLIDFPEGSVDLDTPEDWKNFTHLH
jgi:molybdenum cofactor cytidylyltransferase